MKFRIGIKILAYCCIISCIYAQGGGGGERIRGSKAAAVAAGAGAGAGADTSFSTTTITADGTTTSSSSSPSPTTDLPPGVGQLFHPNHTSIFLSINKNKPPYDEDARQRERRRLNVYGWTDRRHMTDPDGWPGRAVGKIEFPDRQYCTGTLVGPSLVLTARHCFANVNDIMVPSRMGGKFMAGYSHGKARGVANLLHVWYGQDPGSDWAIVKIDQPLGWHLGHLVITSEDIKDMTPYRDAFSMTAYSKDKYEWQAGTDPVCSLIEYQKQSRLLVTSCSGEAGASGAAVVNAGSQVFALFVAAIDHDDMPKVKVLGSFDPRYPNFATPANEFFPTWSWLITQPEDFLG